MCYVEYAMEEKPPTLGGKSLLVIFFGENLMFNTRSVLMGGLAVLLASTALAPRAQAGTAVSTMGVTLTITAGCTVSATNLNFGTAQVLAANTDSTSVVTPTCTNTTPYTVSVDAGGGTGATVAVRKLTGPGGTVNYSLYQDAARLTVWGTTGTAAVSATGNGNAQPLTVYGRVPAQTSVSPGTYVDTVSVTVTY